MQTHFQYFTTSIDSIKLPTKFTFPFYYEPHPLCEIAANEVQQYLQSQTDFEHNFGIDTSKKGLVLGKMFGVLIVENLQKETQVKIKALTEKAALLKPQKLDTNLLIQVGNWFSEKRKLTEYQKNGDNKTSEIQKKIIDVSLVLKDLGITLETFSNDFQIQFEGLEHQKKILSEKRNHLEVQQKLAHFANELHEGKSCPLCGALEHPNIVAFDDLHAELQEVLIQIKTNEQQQKHNQKQQKHNG